MNKILLVDDDRELTSLLKELLEMEGFNVLVAHDGEQALELLDDSIDLLLLDVMMPKKNGIDTLKALRQTHQTPVIMLTARPRGSELDRVLGRAAASWIAFSALSWARTTIYPNHLTTASW
ncbi:Copper-sensing two-component system response regulator CpxR [Salmonella enterica subsp. enterica serovar Hvittingfoss str. A4-620]|nr:Copper-sensing two-component system response regulator CpxR [Salmonella enterica subsp. enterica serovar Hvittingfoss str. A4-620]